MSNLGKSVSLRHIILVSNVWEGRTTSRTEGQNDWAPAEWVKSIILPMMTVFPTDLSDAHSVPVVISQVCGVSEWPSLWPRGIVVERWAWLQLSGWTADWAWTLSGSYPSDPPNRQTHLTVTPADVWLPTVFSDSGWWRDPAVQPVLMEPGQRIICQTKTQSDVFISTTAFLFPSRLPTCCTLNLQSASASHTPTIRTTSPMTQRYGDKSNLLLIGRQVITRLKGVFLLRCRWITTWLWRSSSACSRSSARTSSSWPERVTEVYTSRLLLREWWRTAA